MTPRAAGPKYPLVKVHRYRAGARQMEVRCRSVAFPTSAGVDHVNWIEGSANFHTEGSGPNRGRVCDACLIVRASQIFLSSMEGVNCNLQLPA